MRLRELTEAKFRKSVTMFHGTSSVFLPTILSNGLVPNPKKKKWDVDPNISLGTQSRVSLPGSYWTSNLLTATGSARSTTEKFGGETIVVIAQIQTRSAMADEDNVTHSLRLGYDSAFGGRYSDSPGLVAGVYYDSRDYYEQVKQKFIDLTHRELSGDNEKKPVPEKLLGQTFDALTLRIIAHGIKDAGNDRYWNPVYRVTNKPDNTPTVPETEQNLLNIKDKLTRYYRESTEDASVFRHTLRITEPVTYRGANRITHIVEIPDGYFKDGEYIQPPLISRYGSLELPTKFMDDYTSRVGEFPGIEKAKKESYNENKLPNRKLGFKVMELGKDVAISHADKKMMIPLKKNTVFNFKKNGLYLSNNKRFVLDHYTGLTDNDEVLLIFEYDPADIVSGSDTDAESDFTVSKAKLIDFRKVDQD